VLRRIFVPKRDEATGGWRQLYNEGLHDLYRSLDIVDQIKEDEMGRVCSAHGHEKCVNISP
jgi:hypothetical protein